MRMKPNDHQKNTVLCNGARIKIESECSYLMEGYTCSQCGVITRPCLVEKEIMRKLCENYTPVPV